MLNILEVYIFLQRYGIRLTDVVRLDPNTFYGSAYAKPRKVAVMYFMYSCGWGTDIASVSQTLLLHFGPIPTVGYFLFFIYSNMYFVLFTLYVTLCHLDIQITRGGFGFHSILVRARIYTSTELYIVRP